MMQKQLTNVMNDKGYQKDARDFAKKMMACNGILYPCKDMYHFQEWMEAVEADRINKHANDKNFMSCMNINSMNEEINEVLFIESFDALIKGTVEEELADACIRLLDFAGLRGLKLKYTNSLHIHSKVTFTEYIYMLCAFMTNPSINCSDCLDHHISYTLGFIFSWCREKNINIEWYIEQKMKYNELRPYKHGGKSY